MPYLVRDGKVIDRGRALELALKTDLAEISRMQQAVESFAESEGIPMNVTMHLVLVAEELFTNIAMYGHDDSELHDVEITMAVQGRELKCEIRDDGKPFDPTTEAPRVAIEESLEERAVGGLGIHFAKSFMDEITYSRENGKNHLSLRKLLP